MLWQFRLGGGVAPKTVRLRGQSIIEYVLIAAIISLVVVFAGPQVSGAIRNQFNQVMNAVNSGASGDNFMSAEEKTYREAMKTVVNKDAKDWTLDEQKAAATDIAKNGTSSAVYAKAKAAMDAGTKFSTKLTNGKTLEYRIIGINHDDLADGSGKAGLTFLTTSTAISSRMNATHTNVGGWEQSELRKKYATALEDLVKKHSPSALMIGATNHGRDSDCQCIGEERHPYRKRGCEPGNHGA